jgi:hypothetical protein
MSGLTGLIDALLAARLSPRLDVLGIKSEAAIGAPGPVIEVEKTRNDVRLLSNAALDRLIPGEGAEVAQSAGGQSQGARLSVAARVISAVLADLQAEPGPVKGTAPAWPSPQTASSAVLAGSLQQTVADSGLFYESHLLEFASGMRTLAQLSQEPQARWATPMPAAPGAAPAAGAPIPPGAQAMQPAAAVAATAQAEQAGEVLAAANAVLPSAALKEVLPAIASLNMAPLPEGAADEAQSAATPPAARGPHTDVSADKPGAAQSSQAAVHAADPEARVDSARLQAAYRWAEGATASASAQRTEDMARHVGTASTAAAHTNSGAVEVIHPQAVSLVHQQLDLLATSVFRWNGQAWPGVPMDWSIEEEAQDRAAGEPDEQTPRRWSTMLSLSLPRLGTVDLRLSLTGPVVQAHLAANQADTAVRLRADGGALSSRLEAAGLRLQELQVTERAVA